MRSLGTLFDFDSDFDPDLDEDANEAQLRAEGDPAQRA